MRKVRAIEKYRTENSLKHDFKYLKPILQMRIRPKYLKIIDLKIYKYVSYSELNDINNLRKNYFKGAETSKYFGMPYQNITNLNSQELIKSYYFEQKKNRLF